MKNIKDILLLLIFVSFFSQVSYSQNDDILCLPCIQQYISDANIVDVERSAVCDDTYFFVLPNGTREIRYRNDICNPPFWILPVVCDQVYSIGTQCSTIGGSCNVEVELVQGVECVLPKLISSGNILNVCNYLNGAQEMNGPIGTRYKIGYKTATGDCFNFCQQGQKVDVTCTEKLTSGNEPDIYTECTSFEEYQLGNIVPQGGNKFTLFSNSSSQNAQITGLKSSNGSKSLLFGNGSDIDYNINQSLKETQVGRLDFKVFVPNGRAGGWGIETRNPDTYVFYMKANSNFLNIYTGSNDAIIGSFNTSLFNKWFDVSIIFQPFRNTIEIWVNKQFVGSVQDYESNLVTDLNMYALTNISYNEMYVDEICYREWKHTVPCTLEFNPVCVNNQNYGNSCFAYLDGYNENEISQGACGVPSCVNLSYPINNSIDIPTNVNITWPSSPNATFYILNVGKTLFGNEIINQNVGNVTNYNLQNLPQNSDIFVSILPGNNIGEQFSCNITKFRTKSNVQIPACTSLSYPANNALNVPRNVTITWPVVTDAAGYFLKVGTSNNTTDILDITLGNVLSHGLVNLPEDKNICVRVIPYNSAGSSSNCSSICFRTEKLLQVPQCTQLNSPNNNQVNVPTTINLTWPASSGATGYKVFIRDINNQAIVPIVTLGNVTNYIVQNLPLNKFICVTIIPFNAGGESQNCTVTCFETIKTSATDDHVKSKYQIVPNPSADFIELICDGCGRFNGEIIIYDIRGKMVQNSLQYSSGDKIDIQSLPGGIYLIYLKTRLKTTVLKFIKPSLLN
jgi:hypothetical protein